MLSSKASKIMRVLILNDKVPITIRTLASMLEMSERSIHTYLKEVHDFCQENDITYISKRGLGIYLELNEKSKEFLQSLCNCTITYCNSTDRIRYMIHTLLDGWTNYCIALFAEELFVSKTVIHNELCEVGQWFKEFGIELVRKAKVGIYIEGSELSRRTALVRYYQKQGQFNCNETIKVFDWRMGEQDTLYIQQFCEEHLIEQICNGIHEFEGLIGTDFIDYGFLMLVEYICIQHTRILKGNQIKGSELDDDLQSSHLDAQAQMLSACLTCATGMKLEIGETKYLQILLAGTEYQKNKGVEPSFIAVDSICKRMLRYLSNVTGLNLKEDKLLHSSLESFLQHSLVRVKYHLKIKNVFLEDIKRNYSPVFMTCFMLGNMYQDYTGRLPAQEEIAFLALQVGGAIVRVDKKVKAIFVGAGGLFNARMLAQKVEQKVPSIQVVSVLSTYTVSRMDKLDCDLIITTLSGYKSEIPVVYITPLVEGRDIVNLERACSSLFTKQSFIDNQPSLLDYIKPDLIFLDVEPLQKETLIKAACSKLAMDGYVTPQYYKEVMLRESISSTEIDHDVGIPHGLNNTVIKPAIVLMRLKKKVDWGATSVDIIFMLALNFDDMVVTRKFFKLFYEIVSDEEIIKKIRTASTVAEVLKVLQPNN